MRAVFAAVTALALLIPSVGLQATPATAASKLSLLNGGDVSWLPVIEREGSKFSTTAGKRIDPLALMKSAGLSVARVRLWVDPAGTDSSLPQVLALAKRIKAAKLALLLDLHYSDWWADPANQKVPAAWQNLSQAGLVEKVHDYTAETLAQFVDQGTPPAWIQIGNEIGNGMLWPNGSLSEWKPERFAALSDLLNSGVRAVRETSPKSKVMFHLETGGDAAKTRGWLTNMFAGGLARPDGIGLSYYSQWSGPISNLEETLRVVSGEFGLPVAVAETAYPNSGAVNPKPLLDPARSKLPGFALSAAGQAAYATKISNVLRTVAGTRAIGVWWWEVFSPNRPVVSGVTGPWVIFFSSLTTPNGTPNKAMLALGSA
jgi:arabinogalactan endo-1,4-beta-galactosidase